MRCIICQKPSSYFQPQWPELQIVSCAHCGHIFKNKKISDFEIKKIYTAEYFQGRGYSHYQRDKNIFQKNFRKQKKVITRYKRNGRLLEIGSAYGFFLDLVKNDFQAIGFEICKQAAEFSRKHGITVFDSDFLSHKFNNNFDVVCMFDTIEHLRRPDLFIKKIAGIINKGGYLFITTGDISASLPTLQGKKWRLILHVPDHLHFFSRNTIVKLLSKYGFKIVKIYFPGRWRSLEEFIFKTLKVKITNKKPTAFYCNTFDIMEIIAKK